MHSRPDEAGIDANKVLLAIGDDQELLNSAFGPILADAPPLWESRYEPGVSAHKAVEFLLDRIEHRRYDDQHVRALLAGCYGDMKTPVQLGHLRHLCDDSKSAAHKVLQWVCEVGGLLLRDFEDGGARFLRLVLRKRPHTITRLLAAGSRNEH